MNRPRPAAKRMAVEPTVAVAIDAEDWSGALPAARNTCERAALAALAGAGIDRANQLEISILLTDDRAMRALNHAYRGQDRATNVLAFPAADAMSLDVGDTARPAPTLLGDVVVAFETVASEARGQGKDLADHLTHLIVHGILHVMGYNHERAAAAERMERLEAEILAGLGVADPYGERPAG